MQRSKSTPSITRTSIASRKGRHDGFQVQEISGRPSFCPSIVERKSLPRAELVANREAEYEEMRNKDNLGPLINPKLRAMKNGHGPQSHARNNSDKTLQSSQSVPRKELDPLTALIRFSIAQQHETHAKKGQRKQLPVVGTLRPSASMPVFSKDMSPRITSTRSDSSEDGRRRSLKPEQPMTEEEEMLNEKFDLYDYMFRKAADYNSLLVSEDPEDEFFGDKHASTTKSNKNPMAGAPDSLSDDALTLASLANSPFSGDKTDRRNERHIQVGAAYSSTLQQEQRHLVKLNKDEKTAELATKTSMRAKKASRGALPSEVKIAPAQKLTPRKAARQKMYKDQPNFASRNWLQKHDPEHRDPDDRKAIDQDKRKIYEKLFRIIDSDGSGQLDFSEIRDALQTIGLAITYKDWIQMIKIIDSSQDGRGNLSFNAFLDALASKEEWDWLWELQRATKASKDPGMLGKSQNFSLMHFEEEGMKGGAVFCAYPGCTIMEDLMTCTRCKVTSYCCSEHQKKHRRVHAAHCDMIVSNRQVEEDMIKKASDETKPTKVKNEDDEVHGGVSKLPRIDFEDEEGAPVSIKSKEKRVTLSRQTLPFKMWLPAFQRHDMVDGNIAKFSSKGPYKPDKDDIFGDNSDFERDDDSQTNARRDSLDPRSYKDLSVLWTLVQEHTQSRRGGAAFMEERKHKKAKKLWYAAQQPMLKKIADSMKKAAASEEPMVETIVQVSKISSLVKLANKIPGKGENSGNKEDLEVKSEKSGDDDTCTDDD